MTPDRTSGLGMLELAILAAGAGFGVAALIVWAWGGVAGVLLGGGWPRLQFTQLPAVLSRLPAHLADPAGAWPRGIRGGLPGTAGLYAALALVGSVAGAAGLLLGRLATRSLRDRDRGARWASSAELRVLRAPRRREGRLGLGFHHGRLLYAEHRHAVVAFGPPQSGKSAGLAIPALLEWDGPVIASSIKTDLLGATLSRRAELGEALVFDPFELSEARTHTWSPLCGARSWDGALEVAWRIAAAAELDQRAVEGGDFWAVAAEQRLAPLLYAAARGEGRIEQVVAWANGQGGRELEEALERAAREARGEGERADARAAYEAVRAFETQADRTRSSIEGTVQALLRAYRFARVARSLQTACSTDPGRCI